MSFTTESPIHSSRQAPTSPLVIAKLSGLSPRDMSSGGASSAPSHAVPQLSIEDQEVNSDMMVYVQSFSDAVEMLKKAMEDSDMGKECLSHHDMDGR